MPTMKSPCPNCKPGHYLCPEACRLWNAYLAVGYDQPREKELKRLQAYRQHVYGDRGRK